MTATNPTALVTEDTRLLFQACQTRSAIDMYLKIKMIPAAGVTIGKLVTQAGIFTGKQYKNNKAGWELALVDLVEWINATKTKLGIPLEKAR